MSTEMDFKDKLIVQLQKEVRELKAVIAHQNELITALRHQLFGTSSEKSSRISPKNEPDHGCNKGSSNSANNTSNDDENDRNSKKKKKGGGRRKLPAHLIRIRHLLDFQKNCQHCGAECKTISEHTVEKLAVLPLMFYVIEYVNTHTACPCCDDQIYTAKAEPSFVPNSQATPELLAHTSIAKCSDALPLYRQSKQSQRTHCPIDRSKLDRWLITAGLELKPYVEVIRESFNRHRIGGIDETRLQVIKEEGKTAYQLSRLFVRYGGPPNQRVMLVDYKPYKDQKTIDEILEPFEGEAIVCDMYSAFISHAKKNNLLLIGCTDHCRRKFVEALEQIPKKDRSKAISQRIVALYDKLYDVERIAKGRSYRVIKRLRKRSRKILNKIYRLIEGIHARPESKLGKAVFYATEHKKALLKFLDYPWAPISNIMSEHVAKKIAVVRKNMLFCFSEQGAEALANLMTVIYTAELYPQHNLFDYMTVLFLELPKAETVADLERLLPWNISPEMVAKIASNRPRPQILGNSLVA
jgi:transposase